MSASPRKWYILSVPFKRTRVKIIGGPSSDSFPVSRVSLANNVSNINKRFQSIKYGLCTRVKAVNKPRQLALRSILYDNMPA